MNARAGVVVSRLALAAAAGAVLTLLAGPLGVHAGLWEFPTGFTLLRWAVYLAIGAAALAIVALAALLRGGSRGGLAPATLALLLAIAAALPPLVQYRRAKGLPPINDITTAPADPPTFSAAGRGLSDGAAGIQYPGEEFAAAQREAYPDLQPLRLARAPRDVFAAALEVARGMPGWEVVLADAEDRRIEATVTTRWFRFVDDVVVRVRPEPEGTRVDVRSRSRVGRGDAGANAARIREFLGRLARVATG